MERHLFETARLKAFGLTQKWLAEELGVNPAYISLALDGDKPSVLEKITERLDRYGKTKKGTQLTNEYLKITLGY
jgi:predicted transcriptional regulator